MAMKVTGEEADSGNQEATADHKIMASQAGDGSLTRAATAMMKDKETTATVRSPMADNRAMAMSPVRNAVLVDTAEEARECMVEKVDAGQ
jgi:hypothetical protein